MKLKSVVASVALAGSIAAVSAPAMARDTINIVGSSTVYPFATVVAERFGRNTDFPTPKLESTGSGGGLKLFCAGIGTQHPDITNASRRIKKSEVELCASNGVEDITEVKIGSDGIVIANSKNGPAVDLSLKQIFLALAKEVPDPKGGEKLVANPYEKWSDIDSSLPNEEIFVMGPPPTSGTRDAFVEIAMEGGCKKYDWIKAIKKQDKSKYKSICHSMREDGPFVEAGENDNLIVQRLEQDDHAFGIFGYSFLMENSGKIQAATINGVGPTPETIADEAYPVARSLYFYIKNAHVGVVPGIQEYVAEFTSEGAWGDNGYLVDVGLIPNPRKTRMEVVKRVKNLTPLTAAEL
ncbi:Phosphate ABC transporter, periplasmic phosphate-binding protein PstS [Marinobacter nitratireducens]|uniref:Phosphate ABC transporter, periplasmic phosphate-binding protein PstS n=1 Tax=Marinobacter nitratireducens TaxID=1137280 RepID=A0A072MZL5_9GAMM|nr:substrate-binding domain-containing protein [Marinobacter nitratireducens]KEF30884.1 Phosphate ABC transporter, periplasmic phosphate-binding protein PstS [Marinobacter nitratireducens]TNE95588.1 MAG: phosphate ABC transporter substrate-binding protein [Gammaproteobacteria bacterium]